MNDASHLDHDDHDSHEALINSQQTSDRNPVEGLASLDGQLIHSSEEDVHDDSTSMEHRLVKRTAVHQLTPEEVQLRFQHEMNQDYFDSSEEVERLLFQKNVQTDEDYQRFLLSRQWTRDDSDELQGSWEEKDIEWLKQWFGDAREPVKDGMFDPTSLEDLIELRLHQINAQQVAQVESLTSNGSVAL